MRRLIVLPVVVVIVWCLVLFVHGMTEVAHDKARPGVVGTLVFLPLLVAVCVWIAVRLWRDRDAEDRRRAP